MKKDTGCARGYRNHSRRGHIPVETLGGRYRCFVPEVGSQQPACSSAIESNIWKLGISLIDNHLCWLLLSVGCWSFGTLNLAVYVFDVLEWGVATVYISGHNTASQNVLYSLYCTVQYSLPRHSSTVSTIVHTFQSLQLLMITYSRKCIVKSAGLVSFVDPPSIKETYPRHYA